jgi:hypothetical protein
MLRNKAQGWPVLGPTLGKTKNPHNLNEVAQERDFTASKTPPENWKRHFHPSFQRLMNME